VITALTTVETCPKLLSELKKKQNEVVNSDGMEAKEVFESVICDGIRY